MSSLQWHHLVTEDFGNTLETVNQRAFLWVLVLLKCWTITACPNPTPNSNLNCKLSLKECHQLSVYVWIIWRQCTGDYASLDNNYMYAFNQLQNLTKHGHNGEDVKMIIFISLAENSYTNRYFTLVYSSVVAILAWLMRQIQKDGPWGQLTPHIDSKGTDGPLERMLLSTSPVARWGRMTVSMHFVPSRFRTLAVSSMAS